MSSWFGVANNRIDLVNWKEYSVPADRLQCFVQKPMEQGPKPGEMLFDTSANSPSDMAKAPWNRTIIEELVGHATEAFNNNPGYYTSGGNTIDWKSLFKERIYRHLLAIHKAKHDVLQMEYEAQKTASLRRSAREYVCAFGCVFLLFTPFTETHKEDSNLCHHA